MTTRTIEDNFDYQMKSVFNDLHIDYTEDQKYNADNNLPIATFAEWLWEVREDLGEMVYTRYDEYTGIDTSTEHLNYNP